MKCEIYKEKNTLDLSGVKLCDLLEIDNSNSGEIAVISPG